MKAFAQIVALYEEIDDTLRLAMEAASGTSANSTRDRLMQKRLIHEQAYFLLCWGQLESEINDACEALIARRKNNPNWELRRGFDFYEQGDTRLRFERRVAMVLDRGAGRGGPHAKVLSYYRIRNGIAHGALASVLVDLRKMIPEFYLIQAAIRR